MTDSDIVTVSTEHARYEDDTPAEPARPHPQPDPDPDPEPPTRPPGGGGPRGGRPHLRPVPTFPDGSRISDNRLPLWQALEKAGPEGLTKPEAVKRGICNYHTSIGPWLAQWVAAGWVEEADKRDQAVVYVLTAAQHTPATAAPATGEESPACPASL
ncbi:hypothetical protein ACFOOM_13995 [Streptomyces echinoruber]|uniref:hypothetical protein n=1 Tax=Streptomyces echinoruber TaxID=68898 RepID=UPI00167E4D9E|nr:hypothetical protein [Streptomyces echinoruber]